MMQLRAITNAIFSRWYPGRSILTQLPSVDYHYIVGDLVSRDLLIAPISWLQRVVPEGQLVLTRMANDGTEQPVENHPFLDIIKMPNPGYDWDTLLKGVIASYVLSGNAYVLVVRNRGGRVGELWYIPHGLIDPVGGGRESYLSHYDYHVDGETIRLETEDVIHIRNGIDPRNHLIGIAPIESVLDQLALDKQVTSWVNSLLKNFAVPGMLIGPDSEDVISRQEADELVDYVNSSFTGEGRGRTVGMRGRWKMQQFGFSPSAMSLGPLRLSVESRLAAVLGIPAIVLQYEVGLNRSTFSNYSEARESAYENAVIPLQRLITSALQQQLLRYMDGSRTLQLHWDLTDVRILQEDETRKTQRWLELLKAGAVTVAEVREQLGLEIADTDNVYLRPFGLDTIPFGEASYGLTAPLDLQSSIAERTAETAQIARPVAHQERQENPGGIALIRAMEDDLELVAARTAPGLARAFRVLGRLVADAYLEFVNPETRNLPHTRQIPDDEIVEWAIGRVRFTGWDHEYLLQAWQQVYQTSMVSTAGVIRQQLQILTDLPDHKGREILEKGGTRRGLIDFEKQTRDSLFQVIRQGRIDGHGPETIARQIRAMVPAGPYPKAGAHYRSYLIARTETKYAQNLSALETYRESGAFTGMLAYDARLGDTDAECIERNGKIFTFDEVEAELASEHPNGTLSFAPVV